MSIIKSLKKYARIGLDVLWVGYGGLHYLFFKKNPQNAYLSMIRLHCASGGKTTDFLARVLRLFQKKSKLKDLPLKPVFLPEKTPDEQKAIVDSLNQEGCYVFKEKFPDELIDYFYQLASKEPCRIEDIHDTLPQKLVFDATNPQAARYSIPTEVLLTDPKLQAVMLDKTLVELASQYLNAFPILDICTMWWSPAWAKEPSLQAAQMYHFDMDRIKWLKFFVYLVDVDENNGPHVFVKRTHKQDKRQNHLLKGGYVRLADEAVESVFREQVTHITGKRGTMFLADTRALHKGLLPAEGNRLVLQLEFTASLFGTVFNPVEKPVHISEPTLKAVLQRTPQMMPLIREYEEA